MLEGSRPQREPPYFGAMLLFQMSR
jgi:hypothetical protein